MLQHPQYKMVLMPEKLHDSPPPMSGLGLEADERQWEIRGSNKNNIDISEQVGVFKNYVLIECIVL